VRKSLSFPTDWKEGVVEGFDLEEALRKLLEQLEFQPEKALEEAEALLRQASRRLLQAAATATSLERPRLLDLAFNLESVARSMKAARIRLRAARSDEDVRLALSDARLDLEESLSYAAQSRDLLARGARRQPL
ncbi:MAG: hypothetical protein QXY39_08170, partial [Thermofilaceae archaeon]